LTFDREQEGVAGLNAVGAMGGIGGSAKTLPPMTINHPNAGFTSRVAGHER
jgi:hypothetical protein